MDGPRRRHVSHRAGTIHGDRRSNEANQTDREAIRTVARVSTLTASASESFDDATRQALDRANKTLRNVTGAEVTSQKVKVDQGQIQEFRVTLDITLILDE